MLDEIAWRDFILFVWGQEEAHAAFCRATNRPRRLGIRSPLDAMIDKACGVEEDEKYAAEFIEWATKNLWGEDFAPQRYKESSP